MRSDSTPVVVQKAYAYAMWEKSGSDDDRAIGEIRLEMQKDRFEVVRFRRHKGVLHLLATVSEILAATFDWAPEDALLYLAAGANVRWRPVRIEYDVREPDLTCLSRIHLVLDPRLNPETVKLIYGYARSQVCQDSRSISPKQMAIANHVISQRLKPTDADNCDWNWIMENWNTWLDWNGVQSQRGGVTNYTDPGRFRFDAEKAREALLNPKVLHPSKRTEFPPMAGLTISRRKPRLVEP
jgi:hypothetical protein